jgi:hypothetical protein
LIIHDRPLGLANRPTRKAATHIIRAIFKSIAGDYSLRLAAAERLFLLLSWQSAHEPHGKDGVGRLAGDVIFAGSAVLLFYFSKVDPHSPALPGFMVFSILYGIAFALLAGFVAGTISKRPDLITGILLAAIIGIPAIITLISRPGAGAIWSQTSALVLMSPAALIGDWLRKSRAHR